MPRHKQPLRSRLQHGARRADELIDAWIGLGSRAGKLLRLLK
ncbi:hypothetical protein [Piscinibacter sp.]|jgi:hypothetical protein